MRNPKLHLFTAGLAVATIACSGDPGASNRPATPVPGGTVDSTQAPGATLPPRTLELTNAGIAGLRADSRLSLRGLEQAFAGYEVAERASSSERPITYAVTRAGTDVLRVVPAPDDPGALLDVWIFSPSVATPTAVGVGDTLEDLADELGQFECRVGFDPLRDDHALRANCSTDESSPLTYVFDIHDLANRGDLDPTSSQYRIHQSPALTRELADRQLHAIVWHARR